MRIDQPQSGQTGQLRSLWQEAFGDPDVFLDIFWRAGYCPDRCRCISIDGTVAAALYWFDCTCRGKKVAYIYAVATAEAFQGKGLCRLLMADTHSHLRQLGYSGAILVPGSRSLFTMYGKMGYEICSFVTELSCEAGTQPLQLRPIDPRSYGEMRRALLPEDAVAQEKENLEFLSAYADLWVGENVLLAGTAEDGVLQVTELLGDPAKAPAVVAALGCSRGNFRIPGDGQPFAMYCAFDQNPPPKYFGLAFD